MHKTVEAGVTLLIALFGMIVIIGSVKAGINWGAEGPRAGFFPFYVGIAIVAASAVNLWNGLREDDNGLFAEWGQLRQVLSVVVPTAIYVGAMPFTGLYLASMVFIAWFMRWLGKYSWLTVARGGDRHARRHLSHLRALVSGPAAQGADRGMARTLTRKRHRVAVRAAGLITMEELANLFHGFAVALQPFNIMVMILGIVLGVIIGVLPGLGGANGVAILLPLTFSMSPTSAIIMLSCIYWGALFGGAITSILFNIPGEPWSVATTFDGYPMAQQGKAGEALTAAFTSSFVGALFAVIMITLVAPLVASFALQFGPAEKFAVYFLAFCSFVGLSKEPPFKTIAAMMMGFALAAVGLDSITGQLRLTFGVTELLNGFDFLIAVIGLFGIGEILLTMEEGLALPRRQRQDQSARGAADLEGAADLLDDVAALLPDRLLDGHHAGRRHARLVHELRHRQARFQARQQFRQGRDRRRGRAGDGGARGRHGGAAADALARRARLADGRRAARRPPDLGPAARTDAVRRAEGIRLGPDRLDVSRQSRRASSSC